MGDSLASDLSIARLMQRLSKLRSTGAMPVDDSDVDNSKTQDVEATNAHSSGSGGQN